MDVRLVAISWTALLLLVAASRLPEDPESAPDRSPGQQSGAPTISLWYGDTQTVGVPGDPQRWYNVLGQASAPSGLASLHYSLNGAAAIALPWGPDRARLITGGDFNVELERSELAPLPATNLLELVATSTTGETTRRVVVLRRHSGQRVPLPYFVDFRELLTPAELNDVGAVVDGSWELTSGGVWPTKKGYDRLIAVGDRGWSPEYEVVARFSLQDVRLYGGVGVAVGWQGHAGSADPRVDWPLEALGWVRNVPAGPEAQIMTFERGVRSRTAQAFPAGASYVVRVRSERLGDGQAHFSFKLWASTQGEPASWTLQEVVPERSGSVLLVTHHADVTWQDLQITPLEGGTEPEPAAHIESDSFLRSTRWAPFWRTTGVDEGASTELSGGHAVFRVPAGPARRLGSGVDTSSAPRLVQSAPDSDFVLETRFDSSPLEEAQEQGIVVLQRDGTSLRLASTMTTEGTALLVARSGPEGSRVFGSVGGDGRAAAPQHLRLERTGDIWRARSAADGVRWSDVATFSLDFEVAEVGLYAATSDAQDTAFTARAAYFLELSDAERFGAFNQAPRFTSALPALALPGARFDHPMPSDDPDGDRTRVQAVALPPWITEARDTSATRLQGRPTHEHAGAATISVQVFDPHGGRHVETGTMLVTARSAASVIRDDFGLAALGSHWRLTDPEGAASLSVLDGSLRVLVEPGPQRDIWPGRLSAPRLLQTLADGDVSLLAHFGELGPGGGRSQGLLLQEADDTFVRCGPYHSNDGVRILAAVVRSGELLQVRTSVARAPVHWVRLTRLGPVALCEYSADELEWIESGRVDSDLVVTAGGLFFGHSAAAAPAPAAPFEARVEGFYGHGERLP